MRSQRDRDTVTLDISMALLIFVVVVAAGALLVFLLDHAIGDGGVLQVLGPVVVACASGVALAYLWRHRRP